MCLGNNNYAETRAWIEMKETEAFDVMCDELRRAQPYNEVRACNEETYRNSSVPTHVLARRGVKMKWFRGETRYTSNRRLSIVRKKL